MTLTIRQSTELFHLVFLRALVAKGEDKGLIALKGGCNLRFFFGSVRYSEDIDFDVVVIAKDTLKNKVERLLKSPLVAAPLKVHGLTIVETSAPTQTETTQRWKVGLQRADDELPIRTKVEFSRRDTIEGAAFEATDREVLRPYGLTPVLATLDKTFGVRWGLVGTTHAYTNGQGIIDTLSGKDLRRGRAGAVNIVPTSTGAAKAIAEVLPNLRGKVDGTAVRVPVVDGSLYDVVCTLEGSPSLERVIEALREAAASQALQGILDVRKEALVSSDILGDSHSSIVDVDACMGLGQLVKIVGWYDNEWGYSTRLLDLVAILGNWIRSQQRAV